MLTTSNSVVNEAIQLIGGNQPPVTGNAPSFDNSTAGLAAQQFYTPVVQAVARQFSWDFSRNTVTLTASGNTPPFPFSYEYIYPSNGIQVWQLLPSAISDQNNPLPVNWQVANNEVGGIQTKVIQTNLNNALAVYNNFPSESTWDAGFRQSVVEFLARCFAYALAGKPDLAQDLLQSFGSFEVNAETRDS